MNDFVWLLNLHLKSVSAVPVYFPVFLRSWVCSTWSALRKWCLWWRIYHLECSYSCFCNCRFPRSQQYCSKLCGCLQLILCFARICSLLWFSFYWIWYCKCGSVGNVGLTGLKKIFHFCRNISAERWVKPFDFSLMPTFLLVSVCGFIS